MADSAALLDVLPGHATRERSPRPAIKPAVPPESPRETPAPVEEKSPERVILEADEIVFKVGEATLTLSKEGSGTIELRAPNVRLVGEHVLSEASASNTIVGETVVSEATQTSDLLAKLIRINGQCVKINC
ncbi:hypothetical protein Mal4_56180 [Maioricimonas rarisocia]|uniref:Uncharacterized protein n=1 Tax=Maioricimonas rarisocia TaxID=2528026 RepID=A0A517ZFI2_9PLAN|nr:hypothetical protein [Maioricimonas rarisocia]QDU41253.1 hypothetical protein Mal4_56180 [Maioricimonas rarisocia]